MIAERLNEIGAIKFGEFVWTSGTRAPYYVDLRLVGSYPDAFKQVIQDLCVLVRQIQDWQACKIAGVPTAGISFATGVAMQLNLPLIFVRKSAKGHATKKRIEGVLSPGDRVILIEDVVSRGGSIIDAAHAIRDQQSVIEDAVAVVEHMIGGREAIEKERIRLHTITDMPELAQELNEKGRLTLDQLKTVQDFVKDARN